MKNAFLIPLAAVVLAAGGWYALQAAEPAKADPAKKAAPAKAKPAAEAKQDPAPAPPAQDPRALLAPGQATAKAPEVFRAKFATTKGDFIVEVRRDWAPLGADRFYNLVKVGYFDGVSFFRVVKGFMVQFGVHGAPEVNAAWRPARIKDDPVKKSNQRAFVTYAMAGPDTRTTQFFINYGDNAGLDGQGFPPFGQVVKGMEVVDKIYGEYGDMPQQGGAGPDPGRLEREGDSYLKKDFPKLDYIKKARLTK
ncbi:MAG: peptidylprolyl isomerase [Elusimicrobia bacterium]|nr:peptidylprolyl isomerase [Elusimicrobiota bacterium]